MRVSTHPALHEPLQMSYAVDSNGALDHGEAMLDDRSPKHALMAP